MAMRISKRDLKLIEERLDEIQKKPDICPKQFDIKFEKKRTIKWIITFEHITFPYKKLFEVLGIIDGTYINHEYEIKHIFAERLFNFIVTNIYNKTLISSLFHLISRTIDDNIMKTNYELFGDYYLENEFEKYFKLKYKKEKEKILSIFKRLIKIKYDEDDEEEDNDEEDDEEDDEDSDNKNINWNKELIELYICNNPDEWIDSIIRCKKHEDIEYIPMTSYYRRKPAVICWYKQQVS